MHPNQHPQGIQAKRPTAEQVAYARQHARAESFQTGAAPAPSQRPMKPRGWYADPWQQATYRWWDGGNWTGHVHGTGANDRKPLLPSFLSWPVVIFSPIAIFCVILVGISSPVSILLGLFPILIVAPVLIWLARLEPEPWSSCLHAFLWGASVAGVISGVINTLVALGLGDAYAAVCSAPFIEELTKAAAIVWAVRRFEVDGIIDGIVYAGWVALGFAVIEDFTYFAEASSEGTLGLTFFMRAILFPFVHPLFTAWTGLAIGMAIRAKAAWYHGWWGLGIAMLLHATWNGTLTFAGMNSGAAGPIAILVTFGMFVMLFIASMVAVIMVRQRNYQRFQQLLPWLAQRYRIPPEQAWVLYDPWTRKRTRETLAPGRRKAFDLQNVALARLAALFDHPKPPNPACEKRLVSLLRQARQLGGFDGPQRRG